MRQIFFAFMAGAALLILAATAHAWPGTVVAVRDGDTIVVERRNGVREVIRLYGVDAPEKRWKGRWESQPFSQKATEFARALFAGEDNVDVTIWEMGEESYGRIVGGVITLRNGLTVQEEIVAAGFAWVDPLYCKPGQVKECRNWMAMEREAAKERRGLWRALDWRDKPVAPWKWRGSKTQDRRTGKARHAMEGM